MRNFLIIVHGQTNNGQPITLNHWQSTELGRTCRVMEGLAATYKHTPGKVAELVELGANGAIISTIGDIVNGNLSLDCVTTFDIHWCEVHGAVKPEGYKGCAAVSEQAADLVKAYEREGDIEEGQVQDASEMWQARRV